MTVEERKSWIKKLINKANKTKEDYLVLGKAYEKHMLLLKQEATKKKENAAKSFKKSVDLFTTTIE